MQQHRPLTDREESVCVLDERTDAPLGQSILPTEADQSGVRQLCYATAGRAEPQVARPIHC
jgi:hypothetical protein